MALVENNPAWRVGPAAGGIDHHQRMIGDDQVSLTPSPLGSLNEAFPIMRAAGVDALAAPVGQRGRAGSAKQARQPAGQVAADHVAVLAVGRPPPDQLRQHRCSSNERPLHRIFQIEQAKIILAALADDDFALALLIIGEQPPPFGIELPLERLGEGRNPHGTLRALGPQRGGGEIGQGLANPRSRLGEQHIGFTRSWARREHRRRLARHRPLAFARLRTFAGQFSKPGLGVG